MNGEGQVQIDRGRWRYRFALDSDNIAIYKSRRAGQGLAPEEAWRNLAALGISDAFVVPVPGGWQPFVEVGDGRQRWVLQKRMTLAEAEATASHFLLSLADAIVNAAPPLASEKEDGSQSLHVPEPPPAPAEEKAAEAALAHARTKRESAGWELIYSRQRAAR
ncbi:MAG: hypothetical protein M0005_14105 [Actinomycetota bacterium]|nr:hypothetical protein [Actinomycetota bacterium]